MKEVSITLNPVYWRYIIWRIFPTFAVVAVTAIISMITPSDSFVKAFSTHLLPYLLGMLITAVFFSHVEWFRKNLSIEIAEGKINGSWIGLFNRKQKFLLKELDRTNLLQKGSYQKSFGTHKLYSVRGEAIMFVPFIYKKMLVDEFYKILKDIQDENLKDKKQRQINWSER